MPFQLNFVFSNKYQLYSWIFCQQRLSCPLFLLQLYQLKFHHLQNNSTTISILFFPAFQYHIDFSDIFDAKGITNELFFPYRIINQLCVFVMKSIERMCGCILSVSLNQRTKKIMFAESFKPYKSVGWETLSTSWDALEKYYVKIKAQSSVFHVKYYLWARVVVQQVKSLIWSPKFHIEYRYSLDFSVCGPNFC